jgi:hypothetical protein
MKALRITVYILGALFLALFALIVVASYLDKGDQMAPSITQSMTVGGKTVHFVNKGAASYAAGNDGDAIVVNGQRLDLPDGDEFIAEIGADGSVTVRPGKP